MDPKYSAKLLPIRSKEIRSPLEQQQAGPSKSSFRTTTPRPGSENVSARSDLKDGRHARESPRGHDYSNVQAQDYARMHLGDTYTAKTMIFQQLRHPTGTEEDDKQIGLLEALAFENMNTRIDSISAPQGDTCRWLFKTEQYRSWRGALKNSHSRFLWIKGKPGAGKSTMMHLAVHQAPTDFHTGVIVAHFFNARGVSMAKSTQGMYRNLIGQILSELPQLPSEIPSSVAASLQKHGWSIAVLQNMLRTAVLHLDQNESLVCYIDALDECAEDDIRDAIDHFKELANLAATHDIKFLICFASRHYPTITMLNHLEIDLDKQYGHQQDISNYVRNSLQVSGQRGTELQQSILNRSAGVFLWAVLTVRELNKVNDRGGTREDLRARLDKVPSGVQNLFSDIMQPGDGDLLTTLQWVLFAWRPLTVKELYCAIQTSRKAQPKDVWDETEIDDGEMRRFILASSKGLVDFSDNSPHFARIRRRWARHPGDREVTTQLIHESLREYLLRGGLMKLDPTLLVNTKALVHARLAEACQTYVSRVEQGLQSEFCYRSVKLHLLGYVVRATVHHMTIAFTHDALPPAVLGQFAHCWLTSALIIRHDRPFCSEPRNSAIMLCLCLQNSCEQMSTKGRKRIIKSLRFERRSRHTSHDFPEWDVDWHPEDEEKLPLFQAAVDTGTVDVLQLSYRKGWKRMFGHMLSEVLITASALGLTDVISLLLKCVADVETLDFPNYEDMLFTACENLQERATKLLLRKGAEPSLDMIRGMARSGEWECAQDGSEEARLRIMERLLEAGADITGRRFRSCVAKRPEIIELLEEGDAEIRYCTDVGDSSLDTCKHGEPLRRRA